MDESATYTLRTPRLSKGDFKILSTFIQSTFGIKMPATKIKMVESRLGKRLKILKITSYSDYCEYLFSQKGQQNELPHFINAITTNKTDFFREPNHFTYLVEKALPSLIETKGAGIKKKLNAWSSACSRGHEPYTLAMFLNSFSSRQRGFDYSILATDISTKVLDIAKTAIYSEDEIDPVPMDFRKKYLLKSRDRSRGLVRIAPGLRKKILFRQLNLMDREFGIRQQMDIIFCRNVIIYFNQETTYKLLRKICNQLVPGGYLFMGHSEVIDCSILPLASVAPTIYKKK